MMILLLEGVIRQRFGVAMGYREKQLRLTGLIGLTG